MGVHYFELDFPPGTAFARFPFVVGGLPVADRGCVISHRESGDMRFSAPDANPNRDRFFSSLGIEARRLHARRQTHSRVVRVAGEGEVLEGDGLVSAEARDVLSVTVADCLPIFLLDTVRGSVAALHSGWKGTGIVRVALDLMAERWGSRPEDVAAVLGPCIRSCCYAVDEERASAFEAEFGPSEGGAATEREYPLGPVIRRGGGRVFIDLQAANAHLLRAAGVENLAVCTNCTFTDERLGSFRREGPGRFTRMVAAVGQFS